MKRCRQPRPIRNRVEEGEPERDRFQLDAALEFIEAIAQRRDLLDDEPAEAEDGGNRGGDAPAKAEFCGGRRKPQRRN